MDAVFAPIFRYFDVFDQTDRSLGLCRHAEGARMAEGNWRSGRACAAAVGPDYPQLLQAFLVRHNAHMLKLAA